MKTCKKTLSLVMVFVLVMSLFAVSAGADFTDQSEITNDEAAVVLTALGVIEGYDDGSYQPDTVLTREQGVPLEGRHVIATVGAAGALVAFFRATLERGDEVLVPAPYFVEYGFYCGHFGGVLRPVPMRGPDFALDPEALLAQVTDRTRAILLNSPNNPTGAIYAEPALRALADAVNRLNATRARPLFLLSDEPYRVFAFGAAVPPFLRLSPWAVVLGSFSKSLSLAGERIGYVAVNPALDGADTLLAALTLTNRTLGYVNAPILGQRLALALLDEQVDLALYDARRQAMAAMLTEAVPGRGFGMVGHIRLCCAVPMDSIRRALPAFKAARP